MQDKTTNKTTGYVLIYVVLLGLGMTLCGNRLHAQASSPEYTVKAVFLYNFTRFVQWPAGTFSHQRAAFIIGIYGGDPFGAVLDETVAGEQVNGHPVRVERFTNIEELKRCHILYISQKEAGNMGHILSVLGKQSILTVSDFSGFARAGGMINFMNVRSKIKLQINTGAAKSADLTISSKLLRLAEIVN